MEICSICRTEVGKGLLFHQHEGKIARLYFCIPLCQATNAKLGCTECGQIVDTLEVINDETPLGTYALLCERCRETRFQFSTLGCHKCAKKGMLKYCEGCGYARYCSKQCQVADWPEHGKTCTKLNANKSEKTK